MNKFSNVTVPNDLGAFSNAELRKLENQIARKHSGNVPWEIVIWGFGNLFAWIALWPMVIFDVIPLWLGFILQASAFRWCSCLLMKPSTILSDKKAQNTAGSMNCWATQPAG